MNESWHTYETWCRTFELVMLHIWKRYITLEWVTWRTCGVIEGIWMGHVNYKEEARNGITSLIGNAVHINETCRTYEWVMSHIQRDCKGDSVHELASTPSKTWLMKSFFYDAIYTHDVTRFYMREMTHYVRRYTAIHCNKLNVHSMTHMYRKHHAATRCNTMQHAETRCNTLQHS